MLHLESILRFTNGTFGNLHIMKQLISGQRSIYIYRSVKLLNLYNTWVCKGVLIAFFTRTLSNSAKSLQVEVYIVANANGTGQLEYIFLLSDYEKSTCYLTT